MTIKMNPEEPPSEIINFEEVFSDINTPEFWIAKDDDDITDKLIVLDGHSSILIYNQDDEDLKWEAHNEIGQYLYNPDKIGNGIISFPHTFYFEFKIQLTDKIIDVSVNFDGTGVKAIIMPLKEISIDEFFSVLEKRLSSIFTSVLKPNDNQLELKINEYIKLPDKVVSNLSIKLALMGISVQKLKLEKITPLEQVDDEIVEEIFEVPSKKEMEEAKKERKKKSKKSKPSPAPTPKPTSSSPAPSPPAKPSAPPRSVADEREMSPPTPSGPPSPGAPPTPGGSASSRDERAIPPPPASSSAPPSPKSSPSPSPPPAPSSPPSPSGGKGRSSSRNMELSPAELMEEDADEMVGEEISLSDNLYAKGMGEMREATTSLRHTHATWFDRMIPNRAYALQVKISTKKMKVRKSVTSIKSGERVTESADQMMVETDKKLVIKPEFPGCLVTPNQHTVDAAEEDISVEFHVTPLALGNLNAKISFYQSDRLVHAMDLETKVITHRISKWSAILGAIGGTFPAILAFLFNQTPQDFLEERSEFLNLTFLTSIGYFIPLLIMGILFAFSFGMYKFQSPIKRDKSIAFPR